jgi:tetratricopeptide (TPR) repeat protein
MALVFLLPLIAQAGALNGQGVAGLNLPQLDRPRPTAPRPRGITFDWPTQTSHFRKCMDAAENDSASALTDARQWVKDAAKEHEIARTQAQICLGSALSRQAQWGAARAAFVAAHDATTDQLWRAQAGAMAGNAALAQGEAADALPLLEAALADARAMDKPLLAGGILVDRARALVALGRVIEAEPVLADARAALPDDAQVWLLSATLSRRLNKLPEAQVQIENAARLEPRDGEIGVEAGVIAMLAGHEDAARKSWESVVKTSPDSDSAARAKAYLAQIGPPKPQQTAGN